MPEYNIQSTEYYCQKVNKKVEIESKFLIHKSSVTGEVDKEVLISFDCNQCHKCDVSEINGMSTTYNWKKCIHPNSPTS